MLGEIATQDAEGDARAADRHYHDALTLAEELGVRPLLGQCHLGLARLGRRTNERRAREEHLATATTLFRELGMPFWCEQAETEGRAG